MPATQSSSRRRTPYSKANVERALEHHRRAGTVISWGPIPGTQKFVVALPVEGMGVFDRVELTVKEAWLVCLGLAAGAKDRTALLPLVDAAVDSVRYHRRRDDVSYPGYVRVEWDDLVRFADAFGITEEEV